MSVLAVIKFRFGVEVICVCEINNEERNKEYSNRRLITNSCCVHQRLIRNEQRKKQQYMDALGHKISSSPRKTLSSTVDEQERNLFPKLNLIHISCHKGR
ncbi:hypothetical protein L1887_24533 [Cichorium endivia]|nr:hypothetical protein L1887_24533 [Cichorium endivia]